MQTRDVAGKGASRAVRRSAFVPGIIYGGKTEPELCSVLEKTLRMELNKPGFFSKVIQVTLNGKPQSVIAKTVQFHPVTDMPIHIDFMRVTGDTKISVFVPVNYINEDKAPGLKRGGSLNIIIRSLEVVAPVTSIPQEIVVDLLGLEIHGSIHVDKISLPQDVTAAHPDRDFTLATITAPASTETSESGA